MSHSDIFVYEDKHFLGVCLIRCVHIKVFTNQAEINSLPFH